MIREFVRFVADVVAVIRAALSGRDPRTALLQRRYPGRRPA